MQNHHILVLVILIVFSGHILGQEPSSYTQFPNPHGTAAGINHEDKGSQKPSRVASKWAPRGTPVNEPPVSTLSRFSGRLIDRTNGKAYSADELVTLVLGSTNLTSGPVTSSGGVSAIANGALTLNKLAQSSATTGQAAVWNGTAWAPATVATSTAWGGITGTLSTQTDLQTALNAKLATDGASTTLRTANVLGGDRLTEGNRTALMRWYLRRTRAGQGVAGVSDQSRIRAVDIGDSVVAPLGTALQRVMGFGGQSYRPGDVTTNGSTASDQWSRAPMGKVITLTTGQTIDITPAGAFTAAQVSYLAKSGNGTLKLSYQTNKTGGYTDATSAWQIHTMTRTTSTVNGSPTVLFHNWAGLQTGMTVTGTGISGGTTLSAINVNTSVTKTNCSYSSGSNTVNVGNTTGLAPGMICEEEGWEIASVNVAGNSITTSGAAFGSNGSGLTLTLKGTTGTLSANATATSAYVDLTYASSVAGSDSGSGVLNTNNSGAEKYCTAWIPLPNSNAGADYYNLRITAVSGPVDICGVGIEAGGFGIAKSAGNVRPGGLFRASWDEGGKNLNQHFNAVSDDVMTRALGTLDPEIISFKSLNNYDTSIYAADIGGGVTRWQQYVNKLRAGAPNALIVVYSSHSRKQDPDSANPTDALSVMDDWMRAWCATDGKAVFIDMRSNSSSFDNFPGSLGNMWSDNLHLYSGANTLRGGGDQWSGALGVQTLMPVISTINATSSKPQARNSTRPLLGNVNNIRLFNDEGTSATSPYLTLDLPPRATGGIVLRNPNGTLNASIGSDRASGILMSASDATGNTADNLQLWSAGIQVGQFARNYGGRFTPGGVVDPSLLSAEGWRFLQPGTAFGKPGLVAEGRSSSSTPAFQVATAATETVLGTELWSWFHDGRVEYEGTTADSFETTFTYEDPTADRTIYNATGSVAGTGARPRYQFAAPGYANAAGAAADSNLPSGALYYDESTGVGRIKP